jgi:hypothetical protein
VLINLKPGAIGAARASSLGELFCPGNLVNETAGTGNIWANAHNTKAWHEF